jgi:hypothetical protein
MNERSLARLLHTHGREFAKRDGSGAELAARCCSTCSIGLVGAAAAGRTMRW